MAQLESVRTRYMDEEWAIQYKQGSSDPSDKDHHLIVGEGGRKYWALEMPQAP